MGVEPGADPSNVVLLGNIFATVFYLFALGHLLWRQELSIVRAAVVCVALGSPVLLLSMTLLSPNIFSVSFLYLVIALLGKKSSERVGIELFVAVFFAVAHVWSPRPHSGTVGTSATESAVSGRISREGFLCCSTPRARPL